MIIEMAAIFIFNKKKKKKNISLCKFLKKVMIPNNKIFIIDYHIIFVLYKKKN